MCKTIKPRLLGYSLKSENASEAINSATHHGEKTTKETLFLLNRNVKSGTPDASK
jgi:hypothetical protein